MVGKKPKRMDFNAEKLIPSIHGQFPLNEFSKVKKSLNGFLELFGASEQRETSFSDNLAKSVSFGYREKPKDTCNLCSYLLVIGVILCIVLLALTIYVTCFVIKR